MKVVKDEENYDLLGNKKMYSMNEKFQLVVLSTYQSDADLAKLLRRVPNSDKMNKLLISKQKDPTEEDKAKYYAPMEFKIPDTDPFALMNQYGQGGGGFKYN